MRSKPQGATGPIRIGPGGASWEVIDFPADKAEREELVANLFVNGFDGFVAHQTEPSLAPFGKPIQNAENDLDFKVTTALGDKLMELVEFAPLDVHGPKFANAPTSLNPKEKARLAFEQIRQKSAHQGGPDRFLVIYITEQGFWLDDFSIERLRRSLAANPPNFDRVYSLSPHDLDHASVSEIYPGKPHYAFGDRTDEQLDRMGVYLPHPTEMRVGRTAEWTQTIGINGKSVIARFKVDISGVGRLTRSSSSQA